MEDDILAQLLLEYGFLSEEQIEEALEKLRNSGENKTLGQMLVQDGTLSVRALKTLHAARTRRLEAQTQKEAMNSRTEMRKRKTQQLIRTDIPEIPLPKKEVPVVIGFGVKKTEPEKKEDFKPVTLIGVKERVDNLEEQFGLLREEMKTLKNTLKNELLGELEARIRELIEKENK